MHLGSKIKEFIVDNSSLPMVDFAEKLGITEAGLYKIFNKQDVSTQVIKLVCKGLNKKFSDFFSNSHVNNTSVQEQSVKYGSFDFKDKYLEILEENRLLRIELDGYKDFKKQYKKIKL